MTRFHASTLHCSVVEKCRTASLYLNLGGTLLPRWIVLAIIQAFFSDHLVVKTFVIMCRAGIFKLTGKIVKIVRDPEHEIATDTIDSNCLPENWLPRLRIALANNRELLRIADQKLPSEEVPDDD